MPSGVYQRKPKRVRNPKIRGLYPPDDLEQENLLFYAKLFVEQENYLALDKMHNMVHKIKRQQCKPDWYYNGVNFKNGKHSK